MLSVKNIGESFRSMGTLQHALSLMRSHSKMWCDPTPTHQARLVEL